MLMFRLRKPHSINRHLSSVVADKQARLIGTQEDLYHAEENAPNYHEHLPRAILTLYYRRASFRVFAASIAGPDSDDARISERAIFLWYGRVERSFRFDTKTGRLRHWRYTSELRSEPGAGRFARQVLSARR